MDEGTFIAEVVRRTGCGLLLDINNVFVSAHNLKTDPVGYIDEYPLAHVREIHLAGHAAATDDDGEPLLIDAHGSDVADPVWSLYATVIARTGPLPTLIERDANIPPLGDLLGEAQRADRLMQRLRSVA
jgi:hypothetical protein